MNGATSSRAAKANTSPATPSGRGTAPGAFVGLGLHQAKAQGVLHGPQLATGGPVRHAQALDAPALLQAGVRLDPWRGKALCGFVPDG